MSDDQPPLVSTYVESYALEPAQARPSPRLTWKDSAGSHDVELHEPVTAGSAPGSQLVIADRSVSRVHAELTPRQDGLWVRDGLSYRPFGTDEERALHAEFDRHGRLGVLG